MNKKMLGIFSLFLIAAMAMQGTAAANQVTLQADGSTFAQVILNVWGSAFKTATNGAVSLNYGGGGSGQGISSITAQSVNFAGSDAPLNAAQQSTINSKAGALGKINTLPESAGGIVMAYNLPSGSINGPLNLTADLIAQIMQANITTWGASALVNLNPGLSSSIASKTITPVHRSDGSGTTFAFSNYLTVAAPNTWVLGQNTLLNWPSSDVAGKGNPGVASTIVSTSYSIGYVELAYALQNTISTAYIQNKAGNFVNATLEGITAAVNTATSSLPSSTGDWSAVSINDQAGATTYPICTFTYLFVYSNITSYGAVGAGLVAFLQYMMTTTAQNMAPSIGYVPLPSSLLTKNLDTIKTIVYAGNAHDYWTGASQGAGVTTAASSSASSSSATSSTTPGFEILSVAGVFLVASVVMINRRRNKKN